MMSTKILLVRHGQTAWNLDGRPRGRSDVPLDATGLAQAESIATYIARHWIPDVIYYSPSRRTQQTAAPIANATGARMIPHSGLLDVDFGAWEGRLPSEIEAHWSQAWMTWLTRPQDAVIPGGEPLWTAQARAVSALQDIVSSHPGNMIVVVSHTAINRLLLMALLEINLRHFWHLGQGVGAINVLEYTGQHFRVIKMNLTHHLES